MWFFKRKPTSVENPDHLWKMLVDTVIIGDKHQLIGLCKTHEKTILKLFGEWAKVPENVRQNPASVQQYAQTLIAVAECFANDLHKPELIRRLTGSGKSNPLLQWQTGLEQAQALIQGAQYQEAADLLSGLLTRAQGMQGPGVDKYLPITFGYLGECHFQRGDASKAMEPTQTALELCQQQRDMEGVISYLGNLYEMGVAKIL